MFNFSLTTQKIVNQKQKMYSSVDIWPTSSNPANFIPVVVLFYPFENYKDITVFDQPFEFCPNCKKIIDECTIFENDKYKCAWCSKTFKVIDPLQASKQMKSSSFLYRSCIQNNFSYFFIFAIDTIGTESQLSKLKEYLITAINEVPSSQDFFLAIIHRLKISYVFIEDDSLVVLDVHKNQKVYKQLNLNSKPNCQSNTELLKKYIKSIKCESIDGLDPAFLCNPDDLINQLNGNDELFVQINLFSVNGPNKTEQKQLFLNWVTCEKIYDKRPILDGYFISDELLDIKKQIKYMIRKIINNPVVFNIEINAYITNYKKPNFQSFYATAKQNFSMVFQLDTSKFGSLNINSNFAIQMFFYKIINGKFYTETIWNSRLFKKSPEFIPIISSMNPKLLIPLIISNQTFFENFIITLLGKYKSYCIELIPGSSNDFTFSTVPELQWFLRVLFERPEFSKRFYKYFKRKLEKKNEDLSRNDQIENEIYFLRLWRNKSFPISCDFKSNFARCFPLVSYWENENSCIAQCCPFDIRYYELINSPSIILIDMLIHMIIFANIQEIPKDSKLSSFIKENKKIRFPKPSVSILPIDYCVKLFPSKSKLYSKVKNFFLDKQI